MQYWQKFHFLHALLGNFFLSSKHFLAVHYTYMSCHYYSQKIWLLTDLAYSIMMWLLCVRTFALGQS